MDKIRKSKASTEDADATRKGTSNEASSIKTVAFKDDKKDDFKNELASKKFSRSYSQSHSTTGSVTGKSIDKMNLTFTNEDEENDEEEEEDVEMEMDLNPDPTGSGSMSLMEKLMGPKQLKSSLTDTQEGLRKTKSGSDSALAVTPSKTTKFLIEDEIVVPSSSANIKSLIAMAQSQDNFTDSDMKFGDWAAEELEFDKGPDDNHAFEILSGVYKDILNLINSQQDINLEPVKEEFSMLWAGIQASHANELELLKKDQAISCELSVTMAKTRVIIRLAEDDPAFAVKLGSQLEKAWNHVDIGSDSEHTNEAKIETLRQEIYDLNRNINAASRIEGQDTLIELRNMKKELEAQRDAATAEANKFRSTLHVLYTKRQEVFDHKSSYEEKSRLLDEEYEAQLNAIERESARKERVNMEMLEMREKLVEKIDEMDELQSNIRYASQKIIEVERAVKDQRIVNEALIRDVEFSSQRKEKLLADYNNQRELVNRLTLEAYKQAQDLKSKENETYALKEDLMRFSRQRTLNARKVAALKQALGTLEIERDVLKGKISLLERELEAAQKLLERNKRVVEGLDKERSFMNRNLKRATAVTTEHSNQAKTHQIACQNLELSVSVYNEEMRVQRNLINRLEKERDYYSYEATIMAQQISQKLNEIKRYDNLIMNYRKKLGGIDVQLKKVQMTCDVAMYDKEVYARNLHDTMAEILTNQTRYRMITNLLAGIKTQLNHKDEIIHQEALRYDRILKETEFFTKHSRQVQRFVEDMKCANLALEGERSLIGCSVAELGGELGRHCYYAHAAESKNEMYKIKLSQEDVALRQTWENWRTDNSMIRIGASHYRQMMRDIRNSRLKILLAKKALYAQLKETGNYKRLRREHLLLETQISKEKCMMHALREQIRLPINVHRWRVLQATEPSAYEMIERINLLTKKLVTRNSILLEQSTQLNEKQSMYVEVRKCMERSPSLELPEEVVYYRQLLSTKKSQLVNLRRELSAAESQTDYYRSEVMKLHDRMMEMKREYFEKLKREGIKPTTSTRSSSLSPVCGKLLEEKSKARESKHQLERPLQPDELMPEDYNNYPNALALVPQKRSASIKSRSVSIFNP